MFPSRSCPCECACHAWRQTKQWAMVRGADHAAEAPVVDANGLLLWAPLPPKTSSLSLMLRVDDCAANAPNYDVNGFVFPVSKPLNRAYANPLTVKVHVCYIQERATGLLAYNCSTLTGPAVGL